ncbi:uncharacterized protein LOC129313816 [Prosopis cineraria]|uniref:uncharacterized protein LOC129313816 n=1 Tax=Prosopis cineraria TaxID=364024 RepID=UPI00240FB5E2|nr:uncharacterized protein LOC129313816 [Prosopis cineraria]
MRDVISCFRENAVNVSPYSSCSSFSNNACISPSLIPSIQNSVSCVYKITLCTQKQLLITITWIKNHSNQGLSVNFNDDDPATAIFRLNTNSRFFRKKKGSKFLESGDSKIELFWDLSNAKYDSAPEPLDGYYLLILVDSEIALILGDTAEEIVTKKFIASTPMAKSSLISRREHCSGNTLYTTRTHFCETGGSHEIFIRCSGENEGLKNVKGPVLTVCIDKKTVIKVKRLQWNFRGNQTIFIDGLLVDLLWDVHDWFFNSSSSSSGCAVFMFRTRSALDSRLWLEEENVQKEKDRVDFSLLIYACTLDSLSP